LRRVPKFFHQHQHIFCHQAVYQRITRKKGPEIESLFLNWSCSMPVEREAPFGLTLDAFVAALTADRQLLAALSATRSQHVAAVGRGHALAEAMLVAAFPYGGLECPFHIELFLPSTGLGLRFREGKDRGSFHEYQNPNVNFFCSSSVGGNSASDQRSAASKVT
jgi:hypothetical protein